MPANSDSWPNRVRQWRHSLYGRSALFLILGCGSLIGAVVVLSSIVVEQSVQRLLGERIDLARTAGIFIEHQINADLDRFADRLTPLLDSADGTPRTSALRDVLSCEYRSTLFDEGAFLLNPDGALVTGVPDEAVDFPAEVDLVSLASLARSRDGTVASPLIRIRYRPVLVLLRPLTSVDGTYFGSVGGLLQPAATNILDPLSSAEEDARTVAQLVDSTGVVVASTDRRDLFLHGDHDNVLASAIRDGRDLQGRCHSCHSGQGEASHRATEVLAFVPLPTLELGLAVHQPEAEALAPAFALQRRLVPVGIAFVVLFIIFAGLSVHSVVSPITRLTKAVRDAETTAGPLSIRQYGKDEVGELASALELWRERMIDSLASAKRQEALRESDRDRRQHQRQYLHRVLKAQEDERRRVARELHDTLSQDLAALNLELERLASHPKAAGIREKLEDLEDRGHKMLVAVRRILLDLRLSVLENMGFIPTLQWHLYRLDQDYGVRGTLAVDGEEVELEYDTAVTLFRIFQESVQNALQHAEASHIFVNVAFDADSVTLSVEDDGKGFDPDEARGRRLEEQERGLGLLGIEERTRLLRGSMNISSGPGEGTTVRVSVPLPSPVLPAEPREQTSE